MQCLYYDTFQLAANLHPINEQSQEDSLPAQTNQMELEPEMTNGNGHHFVDHHQVQVGSNLKALL